MELLSFHQQRVNRSRRQLFGIKKQLNLRIFLQHQSLPQSGVYKVRITYSKDVDHLTVEPYQVRPVRSLRVVVTEPFDYRHKYLDRKKLDLAYSYRDGCDDIIMSWHSFITDSYYGNLALFDGQKWWTPAHPLLKGTRRAKLCADRELHPTVIRVPDLKYFQEVRIINAMMPIDESPRISSDQIFMPGQAMR